jgi:hypothetical protein
VRASIFIANVKTMPIGYYWAVRNYLVPLYEKDDCMDAGGTEPWMVKVDCAGSGQSRATHRAVAEGLGEILLDKSPFFKGGGKYLSPRHGLEIFGQSI